MLGVCNQRTMETKARLVLQEYCHECLRNISAIPIERLIEAMGLNIEYQYLSKNGDKVLGKLICYDGITPYYDMELNQYMFLQVSANTILVEVRLADQENKGRYRFTLAHELAHWILHREMILSDKTEAAFIDGIHNSKMESQADYFASALLMPMGAIKKYYYSLFGKGYSRSDLISAMAEHFQVSKQAMQIRLESHNLI